MIGNKEFYPTPENLIKELLTRAIKIDDEVFMCEHGIKGSVLEPSAGKGNITDYIRKQNSASDIDVIESDASLISILYGKGYNVVWRDFLTYETYKQYDNIILNPPFSNGDKHLLKAINIAESNITKQCSIYAITNAETIRNPYSNTRKELLRKLDRYNAEIDFVEGAFTGAERKTGVEVALIRMDIKPEDASAIMYDELINAMRNDEVGSNELSTYLERNELADQLKTIPRLLKEYRELVDLTKSTYNVITRRERLLDYVSKINDVEFSLREQSQNLDYELGRLRIVYWGLILGTEEFSSRLTSDARETFLRQVEAAEGLEINKDNIYMLMSAILGNRGDILERSVVSMFDKITKHSQRGDYTTNIHLYDGWYTNDAFKINSKIIYPVEMSGFSESDYSDEFLHLNLDVKDFIGDLDKAFQLFKRTDDFQFVGDRTFENNVMRFKMFHKGTVHVWFKDTDTLAMINMVAGRHYNWLPTEEDVEKDSNAAKYMKEHFGNLAQLEGGHS